MMTKREISYLKLIKKNLDETIVVIGEENRAEAIKELIRIHGFSCKYDLNK